MKYRKLHKEELEAVRKEFVQFLAANSITAEEWETIKAGQNDKAEKLIEMFSEIFWDKALGNISCVELRSEKRWRVVRFEEKRARLIELRVKEGNELNLLNVDHIRLMNESDQSMPRPFDLYTGERPYQFERKLELFNFIEQGARPCKLIVWESLRRMIKTEA